VARNIFQWGHRVTQTKRIEKHYHRNNRSITGSNLIIFLRLIVMKNIKPPVKRKESWVKRIVSWSTQLYIILTVLFLKTFLNE
jgi:hypothetical protein